MTTEPPYPREAVRHDCLELLGLTVTVGGKVIGVCRQALDNLVNGKTAISVEMAIRLSNSFGGTPRTWLHLQMIHDLAETRKREPAIKVSTVADVRRQQQPRLL